MWIIAVMAMAAAAFASFMADHQGSQRSLTTASAAELAQSMAVARAAGVDWAQRHPHRQGEFELSEIASPAWFRPHARLRVAIRGRTVAVYLVGERPPGLLAELLNLSGGSILVGIARRTTGTLHSPTAGDTQIDLPDSVPDGALVWLALRDGP